MNKAEAEIADSLNQEYTKVVNSARATFAQVQEEYARKQQEIFGPLPENDIVGEEHVNDEEVDHLEMGTSELHEKIQSKDIKEENAVSTEEDEDRPQEVPELQESLEVITESGKIVDQPIQESLANESNLSPAEPLPAGNSQSPVPSDASTREFLEENKDVSVVEEKVLVNESENNEEKETM